MLPLKLTRNERCAIINLFRAKTFNANKIYSNMHPAYNDKCLAKPRIHVWRKKI